MAAISLSPTVLGEVTGFGPIPRLLLSLLLQQKADRTNQRREGAGLDRTARDQAVSVRVRAHTPGRPPTAQVPARVLSCPGEKSR